MWRHLPDQVWKSTAAHPIPHNGAVSLTNSPNFADAPASRDAWLVDSGIASPLYLADFESGFSEEQNISGVTGLFSGGLVIRDTTPSNAAIIRTTGQIGSSNPVGNFAVTHNEGAFLVLDFSAAPVDYVAFRDIDSTSTSMGSVPAISHFQSGQNKCRRFTGW